MAEANYVKFNKRLRNIDRKHQKLSRGYVQLVERDGILVPKARRSTRRGFPFRGLLLTLAVFLVFKGFLLAQIGPITYQDRVEKLAAGSAIEQAGAWAMHADPVTLWVAGQLKPLM
ncbi:hypothetical protein [Aliiroseovarius subalbicans]|uniref:hypothetical protein n=1 Tax=Aliiroseovarius subalbicans TaxID=2925840 RepID=UPI001F58D478|nr:hypothetical protein [Aliiroseovarius subalbicans]MCI2400484.1 hypothetical protein [Aliiroseovarius subalbicans]